jgi:UDP-glucuronate decarboxylase
MRPLDGRVVNTFVVQALRNEDLTVFGDGQQTRSFCHVSDEVRGLLALLDSTRIEPTNIGNPSEFTMLDLAREVVRLTGSSSEIRLVPLPPEREGDPMQRCPDITVARTELGWQPSVSLRDGLIRMIDHFRSVEGFGAS